jgi:hypothetical protein
MMTVGALDLSTIGFVVRDRYLPRLGGHRIQTVVPVGSADPVVAGLVRTPDEIAVSGTLIRSTHALLLAAFDTLTAAVDGEKVIRFTDITDREWIGRLNRGPSRIQGNFQPWVNTAEGISLSWLAIGPARAQAITTTAGNNPVLTLGTAPSKPTITVTRTGGTITRVVIAVRTAADAVIRTMQWDGSVTAGSLVVNADTQTITNNGSNAIGGLLSTSRFPILDPNEGADDILITVTGGTGLTYSTSYYKRWW